MEMNDMGREMDFVQPLRDEEEVDSKGLGDELSTIEDRDEVKVRGKRDSV
ncbi:hypothetical protein CsatA_007306 [Cannabis sativa]